MRLLCIPIHFLLRVLMFLLLPEWQDERPPAPSYLRILYLGKILQDDDSLTSEQFSILCIVLWGIKDI